MSRGDSPIRGHAGLCKSLWIIFGSNLNSWPLIAPFCAAQAQAQISATASLTPGKCSVLREAKPALSAERGTT